MGNPIDIIVSRDAVKGLDELISKLTQAENEILKISESAIAFGRNIKNISSPKDLQSFVNQNISLNKEMEKQIATQIKLQGQIEKQRLAEIKLSQQREKAFDTYEKNLNKEIAKLEASQNLYNKVQSKLNSLSNEYKNLATRKELGLKLTADEEKNYARLQSKIQNYDKILKAVDATMGKHQRNVGNYAESFNPLSNSINQLGREMPAFANSVQTGFLAISNNLPIFFDAMSNVIAQNKELQAQGMPTKSVLSQLASSLFSFQTLLSVGVTLLTIYGKEITNWAMSLFGASEALDELNKNQKEFNKTRIQGKKDAQDDIIEMRKYLSVAKDNMANDELRKEAIKKLREQYYYYFKNLTDAQILTGRYGNSVKDLTKALERKGQIELATSLNVSNKQRLIDLQEELKKENELYKINKKRLEDISKREFTRPEAIAGISDALAKNEKRRSEIIRDISKYGEAIIKNDKIIFDLKTKTIGLEIQEDKQREKKKKDLKEIADLEIHQADYLASEYELRKTTLENVIKNNDEIVKDESKTLKERTEAYNRFYQYSKDLVELEYTEKSRIIDQELENQTESINKAFVDQNKEINEALKEGTTTQSIAYEKRNQAINEKNEALKSLEKKILVDRNILTENFVQKQKELSDKYSKEVVYNLIIALEKLDKQNEIAQEKLNSLNNRAFTGSTLNFKSPLKAFKDYYEDRERIEQKAKEKSLELDLNVLNKKLLYINTESEEYKKLISQKIALETQLQEVKNKNIDDDVKKAEELRASIKNYLDSFIDSFASSSGLPTLFKILRNEIKGFGEDATTTAVAITEAFQEMYNFLGSASKARFEAEYENLEMQKNVSIKYAGESKDAQEEINRQYEAKKKEIRRREVKAEREMKIFNIIIDTAQAITSALAEVPFPFNIAVSALMGAMGAAQIAIVNSAPIPQFEKGLEAGLHKGGLMLVNDAKGSNYKETVETPDGNIYKPQGRNTVLNMPKGTKVYTPEQWHQRQLTEMLQENGINWSNKATELGFVINNSNDNSAVVSELRDLKATINNRESIVIMKDALGERIYEKKQGMLKEVLNNHLNIRTIEL